MINKGRFLFSKFKPKSEFRKHVLTLMTGTTIAQAIPIMISPVLTRLYLPEEFGILALYLSVLMVIGIFATGKYELSLPLTRRIKDANSIFLLILIISSIISILMVIILLVFNDYIKSFVSEELLILLYIMPINIFFLSIFNAMQFWLNRFENFKKIAFNKIFLNILIALFQILIGFSGLNINGLVLGYTFGYSVLLIYFSVNARAFIYESFCRTSYSNIKYNLLKHKDFPLVNVFHSISDKFQSDGIVYIITYKFSFAILGFYSMSLRAITTPAGLVGDAVGQVVFSKFSKLYNETKDIENEVKSILKKLFIFATPFFIILFFILPSFFTFVFGENWTEAVTYAQILLPFIYLNFIVSPVSKVPLIVKKIKAYFKFSLIWNIISVIVFAGSAFVYNDFIISLCLFSISRFIYTFLLIKWIIKISKKEESV